MRTSLHALFIGKKVSQCSIFIGGAARNGIAYSNNTELLSNSFNELMSVDSDDYSMFLSCMGMQIGMAREEKLTPEGASEYYWRMLIQALQ